MSIKRSVPKISNLILQRKSRGSSPFSWRGNIRNAAATKTYKENYFKKTGQTDSEEFFKKEVASHLSQGIYYLHKLEDSDADDKSKKAASEIFTKIKQLNIFQDYQELMTEH